MHTGVEARPESTIARWRAACEAGDLDGAMSVLAPEVVLRSPLTDSVRFEGRDEVREVLDVALRNFADLRFSTVLGNGRSWVLFETARIGDQRFDEAQFIELDERGKIVELTLLIRPRPGATAVMAALAGPLARRLGRSATTATALSLLTRPLRFLTRLGDRTAVRMVKP